MDPVTQETIGKQWKSKFVALGRRLRAALKPFAGNITTRHHEGNRIIAMPPPFLGFADEKIEPQGKGLTKAQVICSQAVPMRLGFRRLNLAFETPTRSSC